MKLGGDDHPPELREHVRERWTGLGQVPGTVLAVLVDIFRSRRAGAPVAGPSRRRLPLAVAGQVPEELVELGGRERLSAALCAKFGQRL